MQTYIFMFPKKNLGMAMVKCIPYEWDIYFHQSILHSRLGWLDDKYGLNQLLYARL